MKFYLSFLLLFCLYYAFAQKEQTYIVLSPDKKISIQVSAGKNITWSLLHNGQNIIRSSAIALNLLTGEKLGENVVVSSAKQVAINDSFNAIAYKKDRIGDKCNQLMVTFKGGFGIIFRAYNEGAAYRLFTQRKDSLIIEAEQAEFNFDKDYTAIIPFTSDLRGGEKYSCSFEEYYAETPLSKINRDTLGYLPLLVKLDHGKKALLMESDVQDYPGMFVQRNLQAVNGLNAVFAPYPFTEGMGGHNKWNVMVTKRSDHIAETRGTRNFPWRIVVVSEMDKQLLDNDMVQRLAEPSRIADPSWIKPGKVAWDWWNDWNISHVDFKAGINTNTYKYYIDFAAANNLEYIILDEGWSNVFDMNKINPEVDLKALIEYGKSKNVGLIIWCLRYALALDADGLCKKYADMGVKGFKIDFFDRNDQKMIQSCYEIAAAAARHHLLLDLHGIFAPQGLQRTWPNVVGFEGVKGMENMKWSADDGIPWFELCLPYIRMGAGSMDYTPGAMRNATRKHATPSNSMPMSLGTRSHQVAMYILYESPLQILSDNPTAYMKDQACTDFIAALPATFNETLPLDGEVGEFAVMARRKDNIWYVAGMTNWNERDIAVDCSFLGSGHFEAEILRDGMNASKDATDYRKENITLSAGQKLNVHLAEGGGFVIRIKPVEK